MVVVKHVSNKNKLSEMIKIIKNNKNYLITYLKFVKHAKYKGLKNSLGLIGMNVDYVKIIKDNTYNQNIFNKLNNGFKYIKIKPKKLLNMDYKINNYLI